MMIMGISRPQPQEQIQQPNLNQNQQMPKGQMQMIKPVDLQGQMPQQPQIQMKMPQIQQPQLTIEIKKNRDLENAKNILKNMFDSDDDEEIVSGNIAKQKADITEKVNLFANKTTINTTKFNMFNEEPK